MAAKKFGRIIAGFWTEIFGTQTSAGVANAGDIAALDDRGRWDVSLMPRGGGDYYAVSDCVNLTTDLAPFVPTAVSNGTLTQVADRAVCVNHPGVVGINAGTNSNSGFNINTPDMVLEGGEQIDVLFQLLTNPTGGATFSVRIGWASTSNATVTLSRGACIKISGLSVVAETAQNGSRTENATGYTLDADTWYHSRISVADDGDSIQFQIFNNAGTELWTVTNTANLPTKAATGAMWAGIKTMQSTGGAALLSYVDVMALKIPVSGTRGDF